ncbi:MAG: KH domain-containing protein [Proteobacteria bacterium]|jgi:spoIIIJ-associated protein|nr:KH domain-containing protein [Pseudomonadota bacterium]
MPTEPKIILADLLKHLGFEATIEEQKLDDGGLFLDVKTADSNRLIGRHGQTLGDLQYIANRIAFNGDPEAPRITVDVGGYRAAARDVLIKKAKEAADKVRKWGDIVELEPMNAYDRRVVHQALREDPDIETQSVEVEGTDKKAMLLRPKRKE